MGAWTWRGVAGWAHGRGAASSATYTGLRGRACRGRDARKWFRAEPTPSSAAICAASAAAFARSGADMSSLKLALNIATLSCAMGHGAQPAPERRTWSGAGKGAGLGPGGQGQVGGQGWGQGWGQG